MNGLKAHALWRGKLRIAIVPEVNTMNDLALAYTPGVGEAAKAIAEDITQTNQLTWRGRLVGVISDGSAVLGLGAVGPEAALPVMEGKCLLFKRFADLDALPLVLNTATKEAFVDTVMALAPSFGAINLEDIKAPECVWIERKLKEALDIPVFHDDQHGTAIVVLAGLLNALTVVEKALHQVRVVISGLGAAGSAVIRLLHQAGCRHISGYDVAGQLLPNRVKTPLEEELIHYLKTQPMGTLQDALKHADVFIGVSAGGLLTSEDIQTMAPKAIVFALANPMPEISYDDAQRGGAYVVATGRSDAPNQINNVLAFPGLIDAALKLGLTRFDEHHYVATAKAIASCVEHPQALRIVPTVFEASLNQAIYDALKNTQTQHA